MIRRPPRSTLFPYNDALPISTIEAKCKRCHDLNKIVAQHQDAKWWATTLDKMVQRGDRKSTRLNSSHLGISYAVFCLKKKNSHTPASRIAVRATTPAIDIDDL